jgi:hypothetical protein
MGSPVATNVLYHGGREEDFGGRAVFWIDGESNAVVQYSISRSQRTDDDSVSQGQACRSQDRDLGALEEDFATGSQLAGSAVQWPWLSGR